MPFTTATNHGLLITVCFDQSCRLVTNDGLLVIQVIMMWGRDTDHALLIIMLDTMLGSATD
jgi:hypothetical protein